jgi:hypothetical protein
MACGKDYVSTKSPVAGDSRLIVSRPTLIVGIIIFLLDLDRR